ncbi:MAG TPA: ribulokinase [Nocardioidaceae bacterium]|nr:ribulokinase [Nocardioidaceae bacterium]
MAPPSAYLDRSARSAALVVGVDFGTLSGRAVVVRASDGLELGSAVHDYRHGVLDTHLAATGEPLPPDWALQVPADYVEVLQQAVPKALAASGASAEDVVAIGTDFTACTVLPVASDGTPLCEVAGFERRPHAYVKLWKHHAAQPQADRITELARDRGESWLGRYGGRVSAEWELAKALQVLEEDPEVYRRMDHWVEAADWIVWQLCDTYVRNPCTAGYKAMFQDGSYPSADYFGALNQGFSDVVAKLAAPIGALGGTAGRLSARAADWTGLPAGIAVAVGNVDAHVTAPAAGAVGAGQLVAIMGTSTCHVMNSDVLREVPGMCGVVDGGIVAGLWGYEAGQSGVGDIFAWYADSSVPPGYRAEAERRGLDIHQYLSELAGRQRVSEHGLVALDWHNGNRSVLVDHELSGVLVGATLATRPEDVYRALIEATAFGTRTIVDAFDAAGVPVREVIVAGGLLKNRLLMQIYADVLNRPLGVIGSAQGPALGSAIHAAVAAAIHPDVPSASAAMGATHRGAYLPDAHRAAAYDGLFAEYRQLHDYFGRGGNDVLHRLRALRKAARSA